MMKEKLIILTDLSNGKREVIESKPINNNFFLKCLQMKLLKLISLIIIIFSVKFFLPNINLL